jgi:hypothetical protein
MPPKKTQKILVDWSQYKDFINEFRDESDRAAVVLGAAKLDQLLYRIIQAFLIPVTTGRDELLDGDTPLGTFSAKINFTYRCGLIDSNFARALHMVRKIRNSFAHEVSGCSLITGAHIDRVRELIHPLMSYQICTLFRHHFFNGKNGPDIDFRLALAIMIARLEKKLNTIEPVNSDNAVNLIRQDWVIESEEEAEEK